MRLVANTAAVALENATLLRETQGAAIELSLAYDTTLEGWARALELRDKETEGHTRRVADLTVRLASKLGVPADEMVHVRRGSLVHDIGKMGIPDSILLKPGKLTEDEWVIMRRHPQMAYDMLKSVDFLIPALQIPLCHHERWDGSGYPQGLKGAEIPLAARIFAVVDVYDALSSDRPYREAWPPEKVQDYLKEKAGVEFDPQVVEAFFEILDFSTH
jgi:HD-GYP domain-containing protein (c-di-GMP phosphodiesterase class II)